MVMEPMHWKDTTCCSTTIADQKKVVPVGQHYMECPDEWEVFEGYCYLVVMNKVNWTEAEKDCTSKGGHLASIHSAAENNFVSNLAPSKSLWIGGTDAAVEVGFLAYSFPSCLDRTYIEVI